jgi:hypothetical protein
MLRGKHVDPAQELFEDNVRFILRCNELEILFKEVNRFPHFMLISSLFQHPGYTAFLPCAGFHYSADTMLLWQNAVYRFFERLTVVYR